MKRNIESLNGKEVDLLVIGGGVNGLACARDAVMRGLSVLVVDRKDFGGQTSSNSARIAHCGMRYLQHLDIKRLRESVRERNNFHKLAPHLVESQPFLMPLYGHGVKGKETLTIYLKAYDLLSPERKKFTDPFRRVPDSKIISKQSVKEIAPGIEHKGLSGGAVWYEGQMQNTERLSFSLLKSASEKGADFANYTEITKLLSDGKKVTGALLKDQITGLEFQIKAKYVLNAAGPWANKIFELSELEFKDHGIYASKAFSLITRSISEEYAITFPIRPMYDDTKAIIDKKNSLQFAIPWHGKTMFASLHLACDEVPENVTVTEDEINIYIDRINEGFPGAKLVREDVVSVLWGVIPAESKGSAAPLKHYKIIDHALEEGIDGIGTVIGVKYTTSRDVAEKTIDMVMKHLNSGKCAPSVTAEEHLWGGDIPFYDKFIDEVLTKYKAILPSEHILNLVHTYGTGISFIMDLVKSSPELASPICNSKVIAAQVVYAIREELAETLSDVVIRRTALGMVQYPGDDVVNECAKLMAHEKNWDESRKLQEINDLKSSYLVLPSLHK